MRKLLRKQIPSMFHRRLVLVGLAAAVVLLVLGGQTARLSVGEEHERRRAEAESKLRDENKLPTVRGRVLDRQGRVLAEDDAGWEVAVKYSVITGEWAYDQARSRAKRLNKARWPEMTEEERQQAINAALPLFEDQVEMLWQRLAELGGVDRLEMEHRKDEIRERVQKMAGYLNAKWWKEQRAEVGEDITYEEASGEIVEQTVAHTVVPEADDAMRVALQGHIADAATFAAQAGSDDVNPMLVWTQVDLRRPRRRVYPFESMTLLLDRAHMPGPLRDDQPLEVTVEGVASHILGGMRDVWSKDVETRPFRGITSDEPDLGGYMTGDNAGSSGVEASMERHLRGSRGVEVRHLESNYVDRIEPVPGKDLHLTLDIQLQARIQAIMTPNPVDGWSGLMTKQEWHSKPPEDDPAAYENWKANLGRPLNGAAVVLDAQTSEVLAAVSMPTMSARILKERPQLLFGDTLNTPYINRTIGRPYQPGSTIKPIMLVSAITAGEHALHDPITCRGALDMDHPTRYRCWIFKSYSQDHGPLPGWEAIARSCNIYFYTLGQKMGVEHTIEWYRKFGLGEPTDCGLGIAGKGGDEIGGQLGNPRQSYPADAIFMGIGQGPMTWTPMQAAGSYATLARGGLHLPPTLIVDEDRPEDKRRKAVDLNLDPQAVQEAIHGLDEAVNASFGTGHMLLLREPTFNIEGVKVLGKSGTADPGKRLIDTNGNGRYDEGETIIDKPGDHAWLIAMVQPEGKSKPTHIVAVVVEYAGSGGQIAGPIANQIVWALKQEGYFDS